MKVSTVSCCPCSWPYFLTLSYISGRKNHNMEETVKPASLSLKSVNQSLCAPQAPPVSINTPSDTTESVKSPNMSTDSGFEGENNRPSLLQTSLPSPSKDMILSSWQSKMYSDGTTALNFDGSESTSPKSPKKSTDDSDFNESPFDKKSVPSVGDMHSESDNECGSEHNCTFFTTDASWVRAGTNLSKGIYDDKRLDSFKGQISAFSICLSRNSDDPDDACADKSRSHVEFGECLTCHKVHYIRCRNCVECVHCSSDVKWCGTLSSIRECKDHVIYAEGEVNSEDDYDLQCKHDTETDTSDEKVFDGTYSDETLSAYYVPSNVSVAADEYHLSVKLPDEKKTPICEDEEPYCEEERDSPCLCHIGMCKSERCQNERSKYTTVLKPKAVRPPVNPNRMDYHSSLESLHSQHVLAFIGQHHDRVSAFHERPSSSLSQSEGMHYFFSRSLDMPPSESLARHTTSQLSVVTASNFPTSNSCLFSEAAGHRSSMSDMSTLTRRDQKCTKSGAEEGSDEMNYKNSQSKLSQHSNSTTETESPKTRAKRFSMPWDIFCKSDASHSQLSHYDPNSEPIHMTLEEVHTSLQTLNPQEKRAVYARSSKSVQSSEGKSSLGFLGSYLRQKKCKRDDKHGSQSKADSEHKYQRKSFPVFIKSAFNNFFGLKKSPGLSISKSDDELPTTSNSLSNKKSSPNTSPFTNRALPPLPINGIPEWDGTEEDEQWTLSGCQSQIYDKESQDDFVRRKMDYAASIEIVKDCGWYWGPISGETAEKLLAGEPDGSFVVRDSSDEHYIFSLTFKLNGLVRHVRIEHDHEFISYSCWCLSHPTLYNTTDQVYLFKKRFNGLAANTEL
ncbi:uncharacterized protein LOC118194108 isoform X2 [Stegodyphus dumicola]|uniref:uncharacterized protein LOC118194108 isoform X2 n=1 Tax=Stegodyphus dumicola TaxID=202533 RepID=UPI0015A9A93E|nr:uncharacterized protein LOC118194108 isoform X2 [Stegodyphus dumicola]